MWLTLSCMILDELWLWCWEGLGAGGEGDDRGWYGWMASPTWWTWVWVKSGSWWWTERPGMLWFIGLQRVRHDWAIELDWIHLLPWVFACLWIPFFGSTDKNSDSCLKTAMTVWLSVTKPTRVSIHRYCTLFFSKIVKLYWFHYFASLWEFFSAKLKGQGLVTDHWSSG